MLIHLESKEALISAVRYAEQPIAFLVGSPLSKDSTGGVPDVVEMVRLIHNEVSEKAPRELQRLRQEIFQRAGADAYQRAMQWLQGNVSQTAVNRVVRTAVLNARKPPVSLPAAETPLSDKEPGDWYIPLGTLDLAKVMALRSQMFKGPILTTNFDPLLSLAMKATGVHCSRVVIDADGILPKDVDDDLSKCTVIHLHGYWRGSDTLHTPTQLRSARPKLKASLQRLLRRRTLVVIAYGGWDDVFTSALAELLNDDQAELDVLWCFYDKDEVLINARNERLLASISGAITRGRFRAYSGIDCHSIFSEIAAAIEEQQTVLSGAAPPQMDAGELQRRAESKICETRTPMCSSTVAWTSPATATSMQPLGAGELKAVAQLPMAVSPPRFDPSARFVSVPFVRKGDQVIGRGAELRNLRRQLESGRATSIGQTAAFHGLGGLGKTQLAIEYAYAYQDYYLGGVYWLTADQDIDAQLSRLAVNAAWISPESDLKDKLAVATHQIKTRPGTLIVFDNVESRADIEPYLPVPGNGAHVLLTSRQPVTGFTEVPLDLLDENVALEMLLTESGKSMEGASEEHVAREVVQELGCLPLAIEIAGAYLKNRPMPWIDYLARLRKHPRETLSGKFISSWTRHETDIYRTLDISEELIMDEPLLGPLLDVLTWSGPAPMGLSLLNTMLNLSDSSELAPALGLGLKLKILQKTPGSRSYAVHRLVREVRREHVSFSKLKPAPQDVINRLGAWFGAHRQNFSDLAEYEAESDHLRAWQTHAEKLDPMEAARLTWLRAYPPYHRGQVHEVRAFIEKSGSSLK